MVNVPMLLLNTSFLLDYGIRLKVKPLKTDVDLKT